MKVYIAIAFEAYQGHWGEDMRVFSTREAAEAYAALRDDEDELLDWEVYEQEVLTTTAQEERA